MNFCGVIEGILYVVGDDGISLNELTSVLDISSEEIKELLTKLNNEYNNSNRGFVIKQFGEKYKLVTKKEHKQYYEKLANVEKNETLSQSALEVLAIIAYNGPITRSQIDEIRGVESSYLIRKLLCHNLIMEVGRSESLGKPILYNITEGFLDYLGLNSIDDLPKIDINDTPVEKEVDLYNSRYVE